MIGDTPILCGGKDPDIGTPPADQGYFHSDINDIDKYEDCVKFIQINGAYKWVTAGSLSQARMASGSGSIVIEDQLLVSGGVLAGTQKFFKLNELVSLNGEFTSSALKSPAFFGHCMVQINETSALANGEIGFSHDKKTTFMNFKSGITSTGPEMINKRHGHGCGKVMIGGNTIIFVIGSGTPNPDEIEKDKTEYLNLDKDGSVWKAGKYLLF